MRHGRYTIIRKLAEGGMAEIFLARQHGSEGFQKLVVLKRILTAFYADHQFRNMLVDEAHISMGLTHNNIAQILDVGRAGGRFFLVMELVDGWDLGRLLARGNKAGRPLPTGLGVHILADACRALSYAHGRCDENGRPLRIVHRDVSPQNILVSEQGEVKIIDFGIAKAMTKREQTGTGVVKGKLAFMSPEQARGQPIDARSDLYAVGILLYMVATGRRPFDGPTDMEVLLKVQSGTYPPPASVAPGLSPELAQIIDKAMMSDRDRRYQSADELLVDLEAVLRTEFASAGQTSLKLWLAQLAKHDGEVPISRAERIRTARPGSEPLEGESVELGDEDDDARDEFAPLEAVVGDDTVRAVQGSRATSHRPRVTGSGVTSLADLSLAIGPSGPGRNTPRSLSDLSLPMDDEGPPPTRIGRSRGGPWTALLLLLLGGGAALAWRALPELQPTVEVDPTESARATTSPAAPTGPPVAHEQEDDKNDNKKGDEKPASSASSGVPVSPADEPRPDAREPTDEESATAGAEDSGEPGSRGRRREPARDPAPIDPYARARSWQRPEEPIRPGIEIPSRERPRPADEPTPDEPTTP